MGKAFRKRVKKRGQDRKHRPAKASSAERSEGGESRHAKQQSLSWPKLLQSPLLSRYIDRSGHVLVVGDGDFSFGRALVELRSKYNSSGGIAVGGGGGSLTITGYDSRDEAVRKYARSTDLEQSLQIIQQTNPHDATKTTVLHSVDATQMHRHDYLANAKNEMDVIVFNFPHSGQQRVHINRNLMYDFFQSAKALYLLRQPPQSSVVSTTSKKNKTKRIREVHVTIKNQPPYIHWDIESSAKEAGFVKKPKTASFDMELWTSFGYRHQTTLGPQQATSQPQLAGVEAKLAQTWIFEFVQDKEQIANDSHKTEEARTSKRVPASSPRPNKEVTLSRNDEEQQGASSSSKPNDNEAEKCDPQTSVTSLGNDMDSKDRDEKVNVVIGTLVQDRDRAREEKNWVEADRIRDLLQNEYNVHVLDKRNALSTWKRNSICSGNTRTNMSPVTEKSSTPASSGTNPKRVSKKGKRKKASMDKGDAK